MSNTIATAPRWPSMAPHRGASRRATSVYSTSWPSTCSGALPTTWSTIEVALLLVFTVDVAIQDASAPEPYVHPSVQRKAQRITRKKFHAIVCGKLLNTQPGTLYNMHEVRSWPTITVRATGPCREGLRPDAPLLYLWYRRLCSSSECNMRLDMAVFA